MVVVKYDKKWTDDFLKIKEELMKVITVPSRIEHVGSTSIPGMKAKPIVETRDRYNQIKEENLAKVGINNRAGYVQMKEEEYRDFFEDVIAKAKR